MEWHDTRLMVSQQVHENNEIFAYSECFTRPAGCANSRAKICYELFGTYKSKNSGITITMVQLRRILLSGPP